VATPTSVEEYMAGLPDAARMVLEELRTIAAAAPDATETIAYRMPAFRARGRFLVSSASYKKDRSLFPASEAVRQACGLELEPSLAGRERSDSRSTIRCPLRSCARSWKRGSRRSIVERSSPGRSHVGPRFCSGV